ncbi:MAG: hypothetical protein U0414_05830 [Polyangiaceae bacterium]
MQVADPNDTSTADPQAPKPMGTFKNGSKSLKDFVAPTPSATPSASASPSSGDPSAAPELESGGRLMVEAYAIIWLIVLGLVVMMWRRTRSLEARVGVIDEAIAKAGRGKASPPKKKAAPKVSDDEQVPSSD